MEIAADGETMRARWERLADGTDPLDGHDFSPACPDGREQALALAAASLGRTLAMSSGRRPSNLVPQ